MKNSRHFAKRRGVFQGGGKQSWTLAILILLASLALSACVPVYSAGTPGCQSFEEALTAMPKDFSSLNDEWLGWLADDLVPRMTATCK